MESDLSRYHNIDYRDRWRFEPDGMRRLTLRMIAVRIRDLPDDAATRLAVGGNGWTLGNLLAAHNYGAMSGQRHPWLPKDEITVSPEMTRARTEALARKRQRELDIAEGRIT